MKSILIRRSFSKLKLNMNILGSEHKGRKEECGYWIWSCNTVVIKWSNNSNNHHNKEYSLRSGLIWNGEVQLFKINIIKM